MSAFWVTFKGRAPGCVEADDEVSAKTAARLVAGFNVESIARLPYPANPRLVTKKYKDPNGREYTIPSFCYRPEKCKGRSCCPMDYSCTE